MRDCVLVIPDVPQSGGLDFGIDSMSYETGHKFKGISMIPPGLHFIYHSTGMGARQGFFVEAKKNDTIIRPWSLVDEEILSINTLSEESNRKLLQSIDRGELNDNLGPYPLSQHHIWINLSSFITVEVLELANIPLGVMIYPGDAEDINSALSLSKGCKTSGATNKSKNVQSIQPYFPNLARVATYADIPSTERNLFDTIEVDDNRIRRLMELGLDKSTLLATLVSVNYKCIDNLLGELQLSFVLFLFLFSHPALEQWKLLIDTICRSERLLLSKPKFLTSFLRILYTQLNFCPADFFVNELSHDNFLRKEISLLFSILNHGDLSADICEHKKRFFLFIKKKFGMYENIDNLMLSRNRAELSDTDVDILFNLVDDDMPIVVNDEDIDYQDNKDGSQVVINDGLDMNLKDSAKYSWRYPGLYAELIKSLRPDGGATEDLIMVAARLLGETDTTQDLVEEANMFIEFESKFYKK